ncbi:MAG TPA: hypothetical protein VIX91_09180 [Candidatus Acidoferrum sp.]
MPGSVKPQFPSLDELNFHPVAAEPKYLSYSKNEIDRFNDEAAVDEKNVATYQKLDKEKTSDLEEIDTVIGPLLLAIAAAVAVTKTSGDIRNAKRKRSPPASA